MRTGVFADNLREMISRYVAEIGAINLFLLLMLAINTFFPLFFVGFTTHDDAIMSINFGNRYGDIWDTTKMLSVSQGRFTFWWNYPLSQIPYALDNQFWYLAMKYGSFFLLLTTLYYAVLQSFKSSWIALASLVFFLAFIQNGWDHNALTSYPFTVNFFAALFLVSLGLFSTAINQKNLAVAGLSGVLYFFALANELFVLFFPLYVAVLLSKGSPGESVIRRLMSSKKYMLAVALPFMAYLALYLAWRSIHPTGYEGNRLDGFNLLAAGKVVAIYGLSAFPLASLHFFVSPDQQLKFVNLAGLGAILSGLNAAHFIKPAVAGLLFARLMTTAHFNVPKARTIKIAAALAFVGIFLPNLLLGFTQKYQNWVASGGYSYLYTYHSFISGVVFAALVLAYMNTKSRSWHPKLRLALILMGIILIMAITFAVEVRNQYIAFDQKLSHRKWQLMDVVIKSPTFMEIPDGSTVVAPTLASHHRGIAYASNTYWSTYIKYKTGKNVQFVDQKCRNGAPCYSLVFRQEQHSDNQFLVLAKIKDPDLLDSSELAIYSMPNQTSAVLVGSFMPGEDSPKLVVNGVPVANVNVGIGSFSANLPRVPGDGFVQTAKVTGNVGIFPDQITISHYSVVPRYNFEYTMERISFASNGTGQGYQLYGWSSPEPWGTWSDGDTSLVLLTISIVPKSDLELLIGGHAFLTEKHPSQEVDIIVNNHHIATWKYDEQANRGVRAVRIPKNLVWEYNGQLLIRFNFKNSMSPAELGPSSDARRLGLGIESLELKPTG